MGRQIIALLADFGASRGIHTFVGETEVVDRFSDRFLGSWRARRTLRALANCGAIMCRSSKPGFRISVDVPWHKAGEEWVRRYRLAPFGFGGQR